MLQLANARLRAHSFTPLKGMGASMADNSGTTAYNRSAPQSFPEGTKERLQARVVRQFRGLGETTNWI
jgi:hypothetical protein